MKLKNLVCFFDCLNIVPIFRTNNFWTYLFKRKQFVIKPDEFGRSYTYFLRQWRWRRKPSKGLLGRSVGKKCFVMLYLLAFLIAHCFKTTVGLEVSIIRLLLILDLSTTIELSCIASSYII